MSTSEGTVREIASGLHFPEGPIALRDGSVLLVEVRRGTLSRVGADGAVAVVSSVGGGPNGAAIGPDGAVYVANNGGFAWARIGELTIPMNLEDGTSGPPDFRGGWIDRIDPKSGASSVLYRECDGDTFCGPNDIVFDRDGGFWFTDFGKTFDDRLMRGAVYYARTDGKSIRRAAQHVLTANGIGLSPDGRTLYVTETETSRLWSYPVLGPGELGREPWPSPNGGRLVHGLPGFQRFDSLAVEDNGNVCVATLVKGGIHVFAPDGRLLEFHEAPEGYCTNICFGGPDRRTAFITLSGYGQLFAAHWPRPGLRLSA